MTLMKHANGTVVSVSDEKAVRLIGSGFTPVEDKPKPVKKAAAQKPAAQQD